MDRDVPCEIEAVRFSKTPLLIGAFFCSMAMMTFTAVVGPLARAIGLAPIQIGAALTMGGVAWMLASRPWGAASDRFGRRPILLFGFAGFAVSYLALIVALDAGVRGLIAPWLAFVAILLARAAIGLFYAAIPTTSAALVADNVPRENRAAAMAALGAASSAGIVIGPAFVGIMASFDLMLPLYLTVAMPAAALLVGWIKLPRQMSAGSAKLSPLRVTDARLRSVTVVAFIGMFSVGVAQITVGFYALDRLGLEPQAAAKSAGIALTAVGIALMLAQLSLPRLHWPPARLVTFGSILGGVGFGATLFAETTAALCASYGIAAFGMGWIFPSLLALAANAVGPDEQGRAAGTVSAAQGLGVVLGPIAATSLFSMDARLPYVLVSALLFCAAIIYRRLGN